MLCVCVCVCVCVLDGEGSKLCASGVLVEVQMAVYLTSHSDYLTNFHEPLLPNYRCITPISKISNAITEKHITTCGCRNKHTHIYALIHNTSNERMNILYSADAVHEHVKQ